MWRSWISWSALIAAAAGTAFLVLAPNPATASDICLAGLDDPDIRLSNICSDHYISENTIRLTPKPATDR